MKLLLSEIKHCKLCSAFLPYAPNPIVQLSAAARIIVIGQAPGQKAHDSCIPWNDASGDRLREWLGVSKEQFYDPSFFALMPMGFCYPGMGRSGDMAPRKECAPQWHQKIISHLAHSECTILIGRYAQEYYLGNSMKESLTETVRAFTEYQPRFFPLPHPSPRNRLWLKKNAWFESEILPVLQKRTSQLL